MPEAFDPYRKWLGIPPKDRPPKDQPPNHYRLLSLELFEEDADAISSAADRQMAHVRTFQTGQHSALSQKLLNELSAARVCLLNREKKAEYDAALRGELAAQETAAAPTSPPLAVPLPAQPLAVHLPAARPMMSAAAVLPRGTPRLAPGVPIVNRTTHYTQRRQVRGWQILTVLIAAFAILPGAAYVVIEFGREPTGDSVPTKQGPDVVARPNTQHGTEVQPGQPKQGRPRKPHGVKPVQLPNREPAQKNTASVSGSSDGIAVPETIVNSIGMKLNLLPAMEFEMGFTPQECTRLLEECRGKKYDSWMSDAVRRSTPRRRVRITRPFYLGIHEVAVGQFRQFVAATTYKTLVERSGPGGFGYRSNGDLGQDPAFNWHNIGREQNDDSPVINVTWDDAQEFCRWLGSKEGTEYRLPTEAEWEYACRAGSLAIWPFGDTPTALGEFAWYTENGEGHTHVVGKKRANAFGFFDMCGNVWELCADGYDEKADRSTPADDPLTPIRDERRVKRGGAFWDVPLVCAPALVFPAVAGDAATGFRVARGGMAPLSQSTTGAGKPSKVNPQAPLGGLLTAIEKKAFVPSAANLTSARRTAEEKFQQDLQASKTPEQRLNVARKSLRAALDAEVGSSQRYALLDLARTLATGVGSSKVAFEAIDELARGFDIDELKLRLATLEEAAKAPPSPAGKREQFDSAHKLIDACVADDRFPEATRAATLAQAAARLLKDATLAKQIADKKKDLDKLAQAFAAIKDDLARLEEDANDPAANLAVGRFYCLAKDDWQRGLPHLAASGDPVLKELAQREIAKPNGAEEEKALADAWWDMSRKQKGPVKAALADRAAFWYRRVVTFLSGIEKEAVEKRLKEASSTGHPEKTNFLSELPERNVVAARNWFAKGHNVAIGEQQQIRVNGKESPHGLFMVPASNGFASVSYELGGRARRLVFEVAIDDAAGDGDRTPLVFEVFGDGKLLWRSIPMVNKGVSVRCELSVAHNHLLELRVNCPGPDSWAYPVWLEPRVTWK